MMRALFAAVAAAVFVHPAGAQTDLLDAQERICQAFARFDLEKAIECQEQLIRDTEREVERLQLQKARDEVVAVFLARHGVEQPDVRAKIEVARRQGVLWAVILDDCWYSTNGTNDLDHCLDQREKAETWLGNALDEPQ